MHPNGTRPDCGERATRLNERLSAMLRDHIAGFRRRLPAFLCSWRGHAREYYVGGYYFDRRGHRHEKYYGRCRRCGCSNTACYELGRIERIGQAWRDVRWIVRGRLWANCHDCAKPATRLGISLGDHRDCIPF